jgi:hypothetical protein
MKPLCAESQRLGAKPEHNELGEMSVSTNTTFVQGKARTQVDDINKEGARLRCLGELRSRSVNKTDDRIVLLLRLIAVGDLENNSSSSSGYEIKLMCALQSRRTRLTSGKRLRRCRGDRAPFAGTAGIQVQYVTRTGRVRNASP